MIGDRAYFDHAATTPVDPEVLAEMTPYFSEEFGNPSSLHYFGRDTRRAVEEARARVAALIGAGPREIVFTSGGTEADNLAIRGYAKANEKKGRHIIVSSVEHPAVLAPARTLEKEGFELELLPVDAEGLIDVDRLAGAIRPETILVSIMHANNVIGTIEPIAEVCRLGKEKGFAVHTDAVQTAGSLPIDVEELGVDLLSVSAHKRYGPKGAGALYIRKGVRLKPILEGGGHERGLRSGTENVPCIVGMGAAFAKAAPLMKEEASRLTALRDRLIDGILEAVPESRLLGHRTQRLPNNVCFAIAGIEGEGMVLHLDGKGFATSSGSACASASLDPSHVLMACGLLHEEAHGSLRLTLGRDNTSEDVERFIADFPPIVASLRSMSPLWSGRS